MGAAARTPVASFPATAGGTHADLGTVRRDDCRGRRPGWTFRRLPARASWSPVRDPRCRRSDRRLLARPLGLAAPVHAGAVRRACRDALPRSTALVPDEGGDGGLPRVVRDPVRPAGEARRARRSRGTQRDRLRRDGGRAPLPGRQRRCRDRKLAAPAGARLRCRTEPCRRPTALRRLPQRGAAPGGRRAGRRRRQLWGRDRARRGAQRAPGLAVRAGRRALPIRIESFAARFVLPLILRGSSTAC